MGHGSSAEGSRSCEAFMAPVTPPRKFHLDTKIVHWGSSCESHTPWTFSYVKSDDLQCAWKGWRWVASSKGWFVSQKPCGDGNPSLSAWSQNTASDSDDSSGLWLGQRKAFSLSRDRAQWIQPMYQLACRLRNSHPFVQEVKLRLEQKCPSNQD